jgi:hypothetical protein
VASELLDEPQQAANWERVSKLLEQFGRRLLHKRLLLSRKQLAALSSEQLALVDMLVLMQSSRFVGIGTSTTSVFVQEARHLSGIAERATSFLVSDAAVEEDQLLVVPGAVLF